MILYMSSIYILTKRNLYFEKYLKNAVFKTKLKILHLNLMEGMLLSQILSDSHNHQDNIWWAKFWVTLLLNVVSKRIDLYTKSTVNAELALLML